MTYKEKYMLSKSWRRKVFIMNLYCKVMKYKGKDTSVRALSKYFSCSVGLVSENLFLAKPENYVATKGFKTRKAALKFLKDMK